MRKLIKITVFALLFSAILVSTVEATVTSVLLPIGDGFYTQWTPFVSFLSTTTPPAHYTVVDETLCNGTFDYNHTDTVNDRDSYDLDLSSISVGSTITKIEIIPCASKNNSQGTSTMNVFYRLNGVNSADAGNYNLTGTTPIDQSTTTFNVSFTRNATTTLEIGAVLSSNATSSTSTAGVRLSRIATIITY